MGYESLDFLVMKIWSTKEECRAARAWSCSQGWREGYLPNEVSYLATWSQNVETGSLDPEPKEQFALLYTSPVIVTYRERVVGAAIAQVRVCNSPVVGPEARAEIQSWRPFQLNSINIVIVIVPSCSTSFSSVIFLAEPETYNISFLSTIWAMGPQALRRGAANDSRALSPINTLSSHIQT